MQQHQSLLLSALLLTSLMAGVGLAQGRSAAQGPPAGPANPAEVRLRLPENRLRLSYEAPPEWAPAAPTDAVDPAVAVRGEPLHVHLATGEFHVEAGDLFVLGRGLNFDLSRKYRSGSERSSAVGHGWVLSYDVFVDEFRGGLVLSDGNTRRDFYAPQAGGIWRSPQHFTAGQMLPGDVFRVTFTDGGRWTFRALDGSPAAGRIDEIADRNGNALSFQYDAQGRLDVVTDTLGRTYDFAYDGDGRLASVTDFGGRAVTYEYYEDGDAGGSEGDLKAVTTPPITGTPTGNDFPTGRTTTYTYTKGFQDERLNHNLLTVTDPLGQTYIANQYAATTDPSDEEFDRVVVHTWGDPGDDYTFDYQAATPTRENGGAALVVEVTDRNGFVTEFDFDTFNRMVAVRDFTAGLHPGEPALYETRYFWNDDSLVTQAVYPEGNRTACVYAGQLDPSAPLRSRGNLLVLTEDPGPRGADQPSLVQEFEYDDAGPGVAGHNFVTRHVDARGNETVHTYDANGNRTQTQGRVASVVEDWTYNAFGQVATHTHPDNGSGSRQVDTFTYFTPADGAKDGYLSALTEDVNGFACVTLFDVDERGNVVQIVDPQGNQTDFVFNALDEEVRETKPETTGGSGVRYIVDTIYDANGNVVRVDTENRDETGVLDPNPYLTTTYDYDILNVVLRVTEEETSSNDIVTEFEYDGSRNRVLVRNGEAVNGNQPDNVVEILYDERDLMYRYTRAPGSPAAQSFRFDYDGNGNCVEESGHGRTYVHTYDGYDRRVRTVDPMGNEQVRQYDPNENLIRLLVEGEPEDHPGSGGNVRLYEETCVYDAMDRKTTQTVEHFDPSGSAIGDGQSVITWVYTDTSMTSTRTDDNSNVTSYVYDTLNRLTLTTDAKGNETRYYYDCNSNTVLQESLEKSDLGAPDVLATTVFGYDGLDRLTSCTTDLGHVTSYGYDSRDNCVVTVDAEGNETRYEYDGLSRHVRSIDDMNANGASAVDPADIVVTHVYDESSRLVSMIDPEGNAATYAYDPAGRCTTTTYADGTFVTCFYDPCGNPVTCFDANGTQIQRGFDELDRPRFVNVVPGPGVASTTTFEVYDYDGLSRLVRAQDDDSATELQFDSLCNVLSDDQSGQIVSYQYDGMGNCVSMGYPSGKAVDYQFDSLNRRIGASEGVTQLYVDHFVGAARAEGRDLGNNTVTRWFHDADLRVQRVEHVLDPGGSNQLFAGRHYSQSPNGYFISVQELPLGGDTWTYLHDDAERLAQSTHQPAVGPPLPTTYSLDRAGNRTNVAGGFFPGVYLQDPADEPVNQYTQAASGVRQHDDNGNVVFAQFGPQQFQYEYDYRNQMVRSIDLGSGVVTDYAYDALGRRIVVVDDALGVPQETRFVYCETQVIEEQDGNGALIASYVCGEELDDLVSMERGGQTFYFHQDVNRSVLALSDGAGNPVERYKYDDYGAPQFFDGAGAPIPGPATGNPYLWTGRRLDHQTGLYWFRARYYDMTSGRFLSRDPIGIFGDPLNVGNGYTFAANGAGSPWASDPTGLRTPRRSDAKFREQLVQGGTHADELKSYDRAVAEAGKNERVIRLGGGVWVPEKKRFKSLYALLIHAGGWGNQGKLWGFIDLCRCNGIIKAAGDDAGLAKLGYKPKKVKVGTVTYLYVIIGGSVWIWDPRRKHWKPTTFGAKGHGMGQEIDLPKKGAKGDEVDMKEFRRRLKAQPPKQPEGAPKWPVAPKPSGPTVKPTPK